MNKQIDQPGQESPVRAMYARLAGEYENEPTVPDRRGGVVGDRYPLDIEPPQLCTVCNLRPGTEIWVGEGGAMAYVHGHYSMRCEICVLEEMLSYARARAAAIPQLEEDLRKAKEEWDAAAGS
jgi:hypothetical protein